MEVREYKEEEYRIIFGVEKNTFYEMINLVDEKYKLVHKKGQKRRTDTTRKSRNYFKIS